MSGIQASVRGSVSVVSPRGWFPRRLIGAFPPLVEFAVIQRTSSGPAVKHERAGTKAVTGDHTALDAGDPQNPRKVERSVTLPYVPASATDARRGLCADLRSLRIRDSLVDDAALVISELVSNALRHAGPLPDDTVGVSWRLAAGKEASGAQLEIAVRDGGSSTMPRVSRPSISGLGGRGLGIVQTLAGRWGTEMDATTTTVWAVLDITAEDLPSDDDDAVTDLPVSFLNAGTHGEGNGAVELDLGVHRDEPAWGALL